MQKGQTQVSAFISRETKEKLERYVEAHGVKKAFLVESALLHHLQALEEIPADLIIPPRIVVTRETGEWLLDLLENPPEPTATMKALFADTTSEVDGKG